MESANRIQQFLAEVQKQRARLQGLNGTFLLVSVLLSGFLLLSLAAYISPKFAGYLPLYLMIWALPLGWVIYRFFIRGLFGKVSIEDTALLVEHRVGDLQNNLINSVQLQPCLEPDQARQQGVSPSFVEELIERTRQRVDGLKTDGLFPKSDLIRNRNILIGFLVVSVGLFLFWPNLFSQGMRNLMAPSAEAKIVSGPDGALNETGAKVPAPDYQIEQLKLTFNYPAYTRLKQMVLENTDGKIEVLPGTEVIVEAKVNHSIEEAELVLHGRDFLSMSKQGEKRIKGRFFAKENGFYQFRLQSPGGEKTLHPTQYSIQVAKDQPPRITLFLANPKPVYYTRDKIKFFYEAHDDYGISKIDLVIDAEGKLERKNIKTIKSVETEFKDGYDWELGPMNFEPGTEIQYFLEVFDNDNIMGPNVGQSEMFSFQIFDEFKKREDLLALQEKLLEKMIELLADTLILDPRQMTNRQKGLVQLKRVLGDNTDQLIEIIRLTQSILDQAKSIESFPQNYLTLFKNMAGNFNHVREDHIQVISHLTEAISKATPVGLNFPPVDTINQTLTGYLERDILLLVKILNRERMGQVLDLHEDLQSLTDRLKEEFQKAQENKDAMNTPQFKKALEKIRETMQKIMEQLSRQVQGLSEEFLNPQAVEDLDMENLNASLEKLMDLVNQGKMDEAMNELESMMEDMQSLSKQLDQMMAEQEDLMDIQTIKKLEESLAKVEHLEKEQKNLLNQTTGLNKELRSKQSKRFEDRLNDFFASLRKDVNEIQSLLRESGSFLENYKDMKVLENLMDKENKIKQDILDLNRKTVNALKDDSQQKRFADLNKAREALSKVNTQIQDLHLKMFHGFKNFLPQLKDQYDRLEEFTELQDLHEFDALFKNTYPEVYRWENHFRTARDARIDLKNRLTEDLKEVSRLNSEISKKLGSMRRDLRDDYRSLITQKDEKDLNSMSKKQDDLSQQSGKLSQTFQKMQKENPMVPSILQRKTTGASRHMRSSKNNLSKQNVPESIESENKALRDLAELKDILKQMQEGQGSSGPQQKRRMARLGTGRARDSSRGGGSTRMQREKVTLPSEDQYQVPQQFREEILEAMKHEAPRQYERMVSQYYKELVK